MRTDWDVIVVGAGLAGLAAGVTAAQAGADVLVVDAHEPGGRARVLARDGFVFNMGAHALFKHGPGWEVLHALGITPVGASPDLRRYRLRAGGRYHAMPTSAATLLRTTAATPRSRLQLARLMSDLASTDPERLAGVSVSGWLRQRDLRSDASAVASALIRLSTYDADHDHLGADAALAQLQVASRHGVVYLDCGWGQLLDALEARVEVRGRTPVRSLEPASGRIEVVTDGPRLVAGRVVVAVGLPAATRGLLPSPPHWGDLAPPVTAACLDVASSRVPAPGYVLGVDDPLYATTQAPPARQAPDGGAVVSVVRYGARNVDMDRSDLDRYRGYAGVRDEDVVFERFLARMVVTGSQPSAAAGGLRGRPRVDATGTVGIFLAGDWVGPQGMLGDAALASGHAAGLAAASGASRRQAGPAGLELSPPPG